MLFGGRHVGVYVDGSPLVQILIGENVEGVAPHYESRNPATPRPVPCRPEIDLTAQLYELLALVTGEKLVMFQDRRLQHIAVESGMVDVAVAV